eukprot:460244_1
MPRKKNPHAIPYKKPDYHSQNAEKLNDTPPEHKKISLRSSLDIYNRLMHDTTLDINLMNVKIGYSDGVLGDQEICILDWTMIDKGGDVPMHHILYFTFILNNGNKLILWDRKTKLDRLYGSGVTNPKQKLQIILNSTKIRNIQSQNQSQRSNNEQKQNDSNNKTQPSFTKIPKQIRNKNDITKYFPRYPTTDDGFVESFAINDTQQWLKYLDHFGLVVLKVLKPNEANKTIHAMFDEVFHRTLELKQRNSEDSSHKTHKVDINNPFTWTKDNWPNPRSKFLTDRPALCEQAFVNRCCDKMYFIFTTIHKESKLNVTIDNWGISRGTKDLIYKDPKTGAKLMNNSIYKEEQKQWRKNLAPHWDINPWQYVHWLSCGHYKYIYQGALALSEQRMEDGTHLTLPGSANFLPKWCEQNRHENKNPYRHNLNPQSHLMKYMQPIPLRQGEMVIWNYGQCHANTKNFSDRMRLTQYIRMFPAQKKYIARDHYSAQAILGKYKRDIDINRILGDDIDERTQKLLGLKQW